MKYSGAEKGLPLSPEGVDHYSSLLNLTNLILNDEQTQDPEKISFSIPERNELLETPPIINIIADKESLKSLKGRQLKVAIILKEQLSRISRVLHHQEISPEYDGEKIELSKSDFDNLSFVSGNNIDVVIYEQSPKIGHLIQGFKRFSLNFSSIAGLWRIEAVDPSYFVEVGGGENTMFLTKLDYESEDDLVKRPAVDIVKVLVNKDCVAQFKRLSVKADTSGDVINRLFVHNIVQKIALELINQWSDYPALMEEGSVAEKMLKVLDIENEAQYLSLVQEAKRDPEKLSMKIQDRLSLSPSVAKFTGGKK